MAGDDDDAVSVEIVAPPYQAMLDELRDVHGDEIDDHLRDLLRDAVHESFKQLDGDGPPATD
jgi:hypothetical protein